MADLAVWQRTIVDPAGNTVPNAEVEVRHSDSSALADIYLDREGAQAAPNPITADGNGFVRFYAPGGAYRVEAYGGGATAVWDFVAVGRLAEHDAIGAGQFDDDEGEHEAIRDKLDLASGAEVKVAAEAADTAVDLASEPAHLPGDFHTGPIQVHPAIVDESGNLLLGFDNEGQLVQNIGGEFHQDDSDFPSFVIVDENHRVVSGGGGGDPELEARVENLEEVVPLKADQATVSQSLADMQQDVEEAVALAEALGVAQQFGFAVYTSEDDALLDTDDGDFFAVSEEGSSTYQTLYRNDSGTATEINDVPSLKNLAHSAHDTPIGRPWLWGDSVHIRHDIGPIPSLPSTHQDLYALFDGLTAQHTDYLSRETLGHDALGNPIYEYTASLPQLGVREGSWTQEQVAKPKIVLVGGVHGHEKRALLSNYILVRDLCERWQEVPGLDELRFGCTLVVVPCLTPSGVDLNRRTNHNGVNINRNAPAGWEDGGSSDPQDPSYRGPSPLSEPEAQIAYDLPIRYPDAILFIDHHNGGGAGSGFMSWIGTLKAETAGWAVEVLNHMSMFLRREFPEFSDLEDPVARISGNVNGTQARDWQVRGFPGILLETPTAGILSNAESHRHNQEALRQVVLTVYRREMEKRRQTLDTGDLI